MTRPERRSSAAPAVLTGGIILKAIVNAKVVLEDGILENGVILMDGDRIREIGPAGKVSIPEGCETIDAGGDYAGPGLVDIHCHGGGECWCYENPVAVAEHHLKGGSTSMCLTLYHAQDFDTTVKTLKWIRKAMEEKTPGNIEGVHFEGPYLNSKYGASAKTARKPDPQEYNTYLDMAGDIIRHWAFSPEVENIEPFVDTVLERGIPMSFAHTEASPELVFKYAEKGVTLCTHLTNATGCSITPTRYGGTREVCFDEAVMLCDSVMTEIIPDALGVHVRPLMCKLILKTVGIDRIMVVTDCCTTIKGAENSSGDERMKGAVDLNIVNGELYGSKLLMIQAARNFKNHTGISVEDTFKVAAKNPAKAIKILDEVGTLAPGKKANVVIVDEAFELKKVILNGAVAES